MDELTQQEQQEIAEAEDRAFDLWYAKTPPADDDRTLEECIASEYEEGVW